MTLVQVNLPYSVNKKVERFRVDNDLKDKRVAIIKMLKKVRIGSGVKGG